MDIQQISSKLNSGTSDSFRLTFNVQLCDRTPKPSDSIETLQYLLEL